MPAEQMMAGVLLLPGAEVFKWSQAQEEVPWGTGITLLAAVMLHWPLAGLPVVLR
jgi:hypothetical protein